MLKRHISEVKNLTFLSADYQTSGRGRTGHIWESKDKENLLFSFVIKDKQIIDNFNVLSLCLAASIYKVLINLKIDNASIKWPNDVYVGDKKICGILMEGKLPEYIIVGIGLNVNQLSFGELAATSIANELGNAVNLKSIKKQVFKEIIRDLRGFLNNKGHLIDIVKEHNYLLNKDVSYTVNNVTYSGKVVGIEKDCSLIVSKGNNLEYIDCGEVNLLKD